jgi:hypothetical protein
MTTEPVVPPSPLPIGWKEYVALPEWGVRRIRAKIDTGACTSALDVAGFEVEDTPAGPVVLMRLVLNRRRPERVRLVRAPVVRFAVVRNSGGAAERRPVVEVLARLGPVERRIRLTVTRRAGMRFRMLLGREALRGAFVVDVGRKYVYPV